MLLWSHMNSTLVHVIFWIFFKKQRLRITIEISKWPQYQTFLLILSLKSMQLAENQSQSADLVRKLHSVWNDQTFQTNRRSFSFRRRFYPVGGYQTRLIFWADFRTNIIFNLSLKLHVSLRVYCVRNNLKVWYCMVPQSFSVWRLVKPFTKLASIRCLVF